MTLTNFKAVLAAHPRKTVRFVLPKGDCIPPSYHITEVGRVQKDFIDCGGTVRSSASCVLQAWVAANDEDHRLEAGKLSIILQMADKLLTDSGLPVEVEYEAPIISQFAVSGSEVDSHSIVFHLENKRTDCLAKESCGLEASSCCSGEEASCGAGFMAHPKPTVLILCTGNSCRSHMAEGILQQAAGDLMDVRSAGAKPAGFVHPLAIKVMAEIGIDISHHTSKHMKEFLNQPVATVITVCGHVDQACPVFPGQVNRYHWRFEDPAYFTGTDEEILEAFRSVRDEIKRVFEPYAFGYRDALKASG